MTYLARDKAVALFFDNKWYHNYFKHICIHNYVISFLKIGYNENINLNIIKLKKVYDQIYIYIENIKMYSIKFIYKEIEKSIWSNLYIKKIIYKEI